MREIGVIIAKIAMTIMSEASGQHKPGIKSPHISEDHSC